MGTGYDSYGALNGDKISSKRNLIIEGWCKTKTVLKVFRDHK